MLDPFHVVAPGGKAVDQVRCAEYNRHGRSHSERGVWVKSVRSSLLKDPANQTDRQLARLHEVKQTNKRLYPAFLLLNELRWLYRMHREWQRCKLRRGRLASAGRPFTAELRDHGGDG